jgi:hypothetical protein
VIPGSAACLVAGESAATVCWKSSPTGQASRRVAISGDLIAADAETATDPALEVADVICSARFQPSAILERYPGCAVAVGQLPGGAYEAATHGCRPVTLSCPTRDGPGCCGALACGIFVHAWLAAGWPLGAIDPPCLLATTPWQATPMLGLPVRFVLYYEGSSSSSRRWMSSACGAPLAE